MSKKDQLGRGASFGSAASARSARQNAINQMMHDGTSTPTAVTDLPVPVISDNPDNPRNHLRNLDDTVESVREVGVILPIVVSTVDAYLRGRPGRAADLDDDAQYVVVDGHRRLEAARRAGLATIPVRVDDAYVTTDERLLEAAFIANYHREGMTDLEEAHALKQLVDYYGGSQTKACKRLSMSTSTLSSKLSLLKLSPELQKDLQEGERKVEHVRNLGKLSPEAQKTKADERAAAARQKTEVRTPPEDQKPASDFHAVKSHEPVTVVQDQVQPPAEEMSEQESVPEPRSAAEPPSTVPAGERKPVMFPYGDGPAAARFLIERMPVPEFRRMLELLTEHHLKMVDTGRRV